MPLDAQVEGLLEALAALGAPPLHTLPVADARALATSQQMLQLAGEPVEVGSVADITIPVDGAEIGGRVYTPEGAGPHPIVMFLHGGGWVICNLDTHDNVCRAICRDATA
ncbi:MAG: alpha/beta hydrolase, partial [Ilumatobacteraceae bacterium]